jgi:hypothetical protein
VPLLLVLAVILLGLARPLAQRAATLCKLFGAAECRVCLLLADSTPSQPKKEGVGSG